MQSDGKTHRKMVFLMVFGTTILALAVVFSNSAFAQESDEESNEPSTFKDIGAILGLSTIVSGGVSALVNLVIENYRSKKARKIKDIESRQHFYSDIIYDLRRVLASERFRTGSEPPAEIHHTIEKIHELMKEHNRLVDETIREAWKNVHGEWRTTYERDRDDFEYRVRRLEDILVRHYNESRENYTKRTGGYATKF